jgi:hypothetical protein
VQPAPAHTGTLQPCRHLQQQQQHVTGLLQAEETGLTGSSLFLLITITAFQRQHDTTYTLEIFMPA